MRTERSYWLLSAVVSALLLLSGCNALNPLCGSARPAPVLSSLSSTSITLSQMQLGFVLTVNGKDFVGASVVVINGKTQATTYLSSNQLQATIAKDLMPGPGTATVTVHTDGGTTGDLGCSSGGTSSALTLSIT